MFLRSVEDKLRSEPTIALPIGLPNVESRPGISVRVSPSKINIEVKDFDTLQVRGGGRTWTTPRDLLPLLECLGSGRWISLDEALRLIRQERPQSDRVHCMAKIEDLVTASLLEARQFDREVLKRLRGWSQ